MKKEIFTETMCKYEYCLKNGMTFGVEVYYTIEDGQDFANVTITDNNGKILDNYLTDEYNCDGEFISCPVKCCAFNDILRPYLKENGIKNYL